MGYSIYLYIDRKHYVHKQNVYQVRVFVNKPYRNMYKL